MTAAPSWSILIPTLGERALLFRRLLDGLLPQVEAAGGRVSVVGWFNNGTPSLPRIRQAMVESTTTDYLSFVDDDDLVSPDFVERVLEALATWPDYVGFQVQCYSDGAPTGIAYHSLQHRGWTNNAAAGRYLRDISHINPIRTKIAQTADFARARAGRPEDRMWADQLRRGRALKSEVVVDKILYHYLYSTSREPGLGSRWRRPGEVQRADLRPEISSPYFSWSPGCLTSQ